MKEGCNKNMSDMEKKDEVMADEAVQSAQDSAPAEKTDKAAKKDKPAKKDKDKKPGVFARIVRWFREMKSELKKVSWPTAKDTMKNVATVIVCVIVVGACIWIFDWLIHAVIQALLNLF